MYRKYAAMVTASFMALAATSVSGQIGTDRDRGRDWDRDRDRIGAREHDSERELTRAAEQLKQERLSLQSAISIAESHTRGTAVAARVTMDQSLLRQQRPGQQQQQQQQWRDTDRDRQQQQWRDTDRDRQQQQRRDTDRDRQQQQRRDADRQHEPGQHARDGDHTWRTGQHQTQDVDRQSRFGEGQLLAVVTCVEDGRNVNKVIVDMKNNTVVSVLPASQFRDGMRQDQRRDGQRWDDQQRRDGQRWDDQQRRDGQRWDDQQRRDGQRWDDQQRRDPQQRWDDQRRPGAERDHQSAYGGQNSVEYTRAKELMDATIRDSRDERLGDIDDLAVDPAANRVVYAVLTRGGFIGIGKSSYAIPTSELAPPRDGDIRINLTERDFETATGFDRDNWPLRPDQRLVSRRGMQDRDTPQARRIEKATDILGTEIRTRDDENLGDINDLVFDLNSGRILYAIVDTDRGDMPIPMESLQKRDDRYSVRMSMQELRRMPVIESDREANWRDHNWNRRIHESFGARYERSTERSPQRSDDRDRTRDRDRDSGWR